MKHVDFYYDFSCPYAYLAHHRVNDACERHGATVTWKPFLLGGVFRAIGTADMPATTMPPPKAQMNMLDMFRWAAFLNVPFQMPDTHPNRTVLALRATSVLRTPVRPQAAMATSATAATPEGGASHLEKASKALFRAYWAEGKDVSKPEVVVDALNRVGLNGAELVEKAESAAIKDGLRQATDEAIAAGVFGAPAFVVTIQDEPGRSDVKELFWGQDRLDLVEELLAGRSLVDTPVAGVDQTSGEANAPTHRWVKKEAAGAPPALEYYFDFSSPFAYLASRRVGKVASKAGAKLVYKPFLLGGLFNAIGTPNVPLFAMPEPKRLHSGADMYRWAARFGTELKFPTRFPMNTVKPLRMVLALPEGERGPLVDALFRAYWAEDRDIADATVLKEVANQVGLDGDTLVAQTADESLKVALREATEQAAKRGLFGAPSFLVNGLLFWGQDRFPFVELALAGFSPPGE